VTLLEKAARFGVVEAARQMGVSRRTVQRWRARAGDLEDRPCRPHRSPRRTPDEVEATVLGLRIELRWGPDRLGPYLGLPASTTHRILRRHGAHRLRTLFPPERRAYGRFDVHEPGELVAIDLKRLGRLDRGLGTRAPERSEPAKGTIGYRYLHVAIDMASRVVFAQLRPGLDAAECVSFLAAAIAFFDARGVRVRRVLTDNGTGYRGPLYAKAATTLGIRHTRTKPYHPWTNGRAEAFIGTIKRECLYVGTLWNEDERGLAIALYLAYYNGERPHTALGGLPPLRWLTRRRATRVYGDFN